LGRWPTLPPEICPFITFTRIGKNAYTRLTPIKSFANFVLITSFSAKTEAGFGILVCGEPVNSGSFAREIYASQALCVNIITTTGKVLFKSSS
jgi:hypothetical protein